MVLPKLSYVIVVLRGTNVDKEGKLHLFFASTKTITTPCSYKNRLFME